MTELPKDINDAILEFFNKSSDEPTDNDVTSLKNILYLLAYERWGEESRINVVVSDGRTHEHFHFLPVPKVDPGFWGEKLKFDSIEVDQLIRSISVNYDSASSDVSAFMRLMRQRSGRAVQETEWNMERVKRAVGDIEREKDDGKN